MWFRYQSRIAYDIENMKLADHLEKYCILYPITKDFHRNMTSCAFYCYYDTLWFLSSHEFAIWYEIILNL